jgi:hypothetical protein
MCFLEEIFIDGKKAAFSDHQSRVLAQIVLISDAFLNLPLILHGMYQWILQPILQLLG